VRGEPVIDEVYYLQSFKGGWTKWEEKMNITECNDRTGYLQASKISKHNDRTRHLQASSSLEEKISKCNVRTRYLPVGKFLSGGKNLQM
jgi:hypothetical protein